ncbi:pre-rRNA-processing protein esf1 [Xylographa opegraphella]|nr:pre-rRNA-processing protein esf1 [Xylographa opegraphella]
MVNPTKQKLPKGPRPRGPILNDSITDPRFSNIQTDPRFRLPSRKNTHVKVDKRFSRMLRDERFSSKAKVDRYGRRLPKDSGRKELERLYRVDDEDEDEDVDEGAVDIEVDDKVVDDEVVNDELVSQELRRVRDIHDPARNGGFSESSSDDTSADEDEESEGVGEDEIDVFADEEGAQIDGVPAGEITSRIAVVNLDWDNIRAADLMAVFTSFAPGDGRILRVSIYPSEFGKERMEREEMEGPPKEIFAKKSPKQLETPVPESEEDEQSEDEQSVEDEDEDERIRKSLLKEDEGEEFDSAKLRRYQLERLRYYYAVLTCSSNSVAEAIYNSVDGTEYLTTANFFDLRFIPDEMDFSSDKPRDECDRIPDGYRPNEFVTDALQHSKVRLTWDTDDKTRREVQKRAFSGSRADIDENDLKAYLGSDSSEDEAPEPVVVNSTLEPSVNDTQQAIAEVEQPKLSKKDIERQRMRALLGLSAEPLHHSKSKPSSGAVGDMQITFSSGLSSNPTKGSVFENQPEPEETTVEKYVRKEKERKARRKDKMKATRGGTEIADEYSTAKGEIFEEKHAEKDLGFNDPFFTAPEDDRTAATALRKEQRLKKRTERAAADAASSAQRAELELLMVDDDAANDDQASKPRSRVNHFDINAIAKAEKVLKKKTRKGKLSAREKEAVEAKEKDDFRMDVADPRFGAVFDRSEFAVDPSHPRFKGTEGMKALLEEGRRKRRREGLEEELMDGGGDEIMGVGKKLRKERSNESNEVGEDLKNLVERVKGKTKQKG